MEEEQKRILKEMEEEKKGKITKFLKEYPPSRIEAELNEYIIDQPNLTKAVSDFLYYLGIHKFYEGRILLGIVYLCTLGFCYLGVIIDLVILFFKPNPYCP